ncbi:hypothetical protein VPH35_099060 [Triticum aestivum]
MGLHSGARCPTGLRVPRPRVCVGVSVHHAACHDASATLFVQTWAAAYHLGDALDSADPSQAVLLPPPPVLDRSLVADPDDLLGKTLAGMSRLASGPPPTRPPASRVSASVYGDRVLPPGARPDRRDQGRGGCRTGALAHAVVRGGVGAGMGVPAAEPVRGR